MSWLFLSFVILQTYTYYRYSQKDSSLLGFFVYGAVIFQFFHTAVNSYTAYAFEAQGWGEPDVILSGPAPTMDHIHLLIVAIAAFPAQLFLTWKIWAFGTTVGGDRLKAAVKAASTFILLVSLCALISALMRTAATLMSTRPSWSHELLLIWAAATVVTDGTITACLMAFLFHPRSDVCFGEARDTLAKVVRVTIQTGLVTTILGIVVIPLAALRLDIYSLPWYMMAKFYVISFLAHLNARSRAKSSPEGTPHATVQLPSIAFAAGQRENRTGATSTGFGDFLRSLGRISQRQATTTVLNTEIHTIPEVDSYTHSTQSTQSIKAEGVEPKPVAV